MRELIPQAQLALAGDLTDPVCLKNLLNHLKRENIEPEVLINNAGFGLYGQTLNQDSSENLNLLDLNIRALTTLTLALAPNMRAKRKGYILTLALAPNMRAKRKGYILNVASIAAFMPCPYLSVYGASKAYVLSFSEALHEELKTEGVHVTALCPGPIKTNFWNRAGVNECDRFEFAITDARSVAERGLNALFKNKAIATYGIFNTLLTVSAQLAPRSLTRVLAKQVLALVTKK